MSRPVSTVSPLHVPPVRVLRTNCPEDGYAIQTLSPSGLTTIAIFDKGSPEATVSTFHKPLVSVAYLAFHWPVHMLYPKCGVPVSSITSLIFVEGVEIGEAVSTVWIIHPDSVFMA